MKSSRNTVFLIVVLILSFVLPLSGVRPLSADTNDGSLAWPQIRKGSTMLASRSAGLLLFPTFQHRDNALLATNPHLIGSVITIYWSDIEIANGVYDWSNIDRRIAIWTKENKHVALRIMWSSSGFWPDPAAKHPTPAWVLAQGAVMVLAPQSKTEVPLVWDPIYRKYAFRFLEEVARKFDGNPNVLFIDVTPGAETNPYRMRTIGGNEPGFEREFRNTPASDGRKYSDQLWLETVKAQIDEAERIFKKTPLLVTLNRASLDGPSQMRVIGDYCVERGLMVGQNGLTSQTAKSGSNPFVDWAKRTRVYFEMLDATSRGTTGNLMEVMLAAERVGCHFVAVYSSDVLKGMPGQRGYDVQYERALKFGAEMLARRAIATPRSAGQLLPAEVLRDREYARIGATSLRLDLYLPPREAGTRLPLVLWIHGGGWSGGDRTQTRAPEVLGKEYAVASISYRLSHEAVFPAQIHDVKAAVRWLRAHADMYGLDPERIGAWGSSAGGHLAALLGTSGDVTELEGTVGEHLDQSSRVQAVSNFFGPADLLAILEPGAWAPRPSVEALLGGSVAKRVALARLASPVTHIGADDPPFLIVHGDRDLVVPLDQSQRLHRALNTAGVESTLHVVKEGGHGFLDPVVDALVRKFFDRHLRSRGE